MKRELIALAVAGVLVVGCESSGLSPREVPGRSQSALLYEMYYDVGPADASVQPKPLRLPASVAVVQVGEVAPPQPMLDALRKDPGVFARVESLPASELYAPPPQQAYYHGRRAAAPPAEPRRPSLAGVRRMAADVGADYVLLVGGTVDHGITATPASVLDLTIVGLYLVPSREAAATARASAALVDVASGRVIVHSTASAEDRTFAPAASVDGAEVRMLESLRDDVVGKLGEQVLSDVRSRAAFGPAAAAAAAAAAGAGAPAAIAPPVAREAVPQPTAAHPQASGWETLPAGRPYDTASGAGR